MQALPASQQERLREAIDGFDFDQAQALLTQHSPEVA